MDVFYALAEPNRRSILELLAAQGEMNASAIAKKFKITKAAVSQHLQVLKEAKLVRVEKRAQQRIYRLDTKTLRQLELWAQEMGDRYDRLGELLSN
jgi:DNA-binding transcriptional ArsR family regulator